MELLTKIIQLCLLPIFAYLLGSVPWGLILTRIFASEDITQKGSGNIGATNVRRVAGIVPGILTLMGDVFKGAFPVYLALALITPDMNAYVPKPELWNESGWGNVYVSLVAVSAFMGHLFPVYMKFKKGGKGVATAAGCFLVISPLAVLVAMLVFIMIICWFNRVSLASLAAVTVLPIAIWETTHSQILTGCSVIITLFIYIRHKENIIRLLKGTEPGL